MIFQIHSFTKKYILKQLSALGIFFKIKMQRLFIRRSIRVALKKQYHSSF